MIEFLLDTSTIAGAMLAQPNPKLIARLRERGSVSAIPAPVWHELRAGVAELPRDEQRRVHQAFLDLVIRATMPILPYDEEAASWHGYHRLHMERAGVPFVAGQIGAIALTRGLTIVTSRLADFAGYRSVPLVDWAA